MDDGLHVDISGYLGGSVVKSTTVVVNSSGTTQVVLDWTGIDRVLFRSYGGVNAGYGDSGTHFVLDDMRVNEPTGVPVPEPLTAALGLGRLALAAPSPPLTAALPQTFGSPPYRAGPCSIQPPKPSPAGLSPARGGRAVPWPG